jgi:hypothetical protein
MSFDKGSPQGPKQSVAIALAMKKKKDMGSVDYQAPNLMNALKKKKRGQNGNSPTY